MGKEGKGILRKEKAKRYWMEVGYARKMWPKPTWRRRMRRKAGASF